MILTPEIQEQIVGAIEADPTAAVTLPEHAYGSDGRVIVLVDGLSIDLHRHLHNLLIGPLDDDERMHDTSGVEGNVNPHLFTVIRGGRSPDTHCPKGHAYEGNEMPKNSRGYRCRICYEAALARQREKAGPRGLPNAAKTHCPAGHEYTEENTIIDSAGRRRCRICRLEQGRAYMRAIRNHRKDTP
ncbi:HNH endonuclease [Microbacterium phage RubyRalph]|nr:HNH endonuclease [Microbacterium phage RubyRalph]